MFVDNELVFGGYSNAWSPTATGDNVSPVTYDTSPLGNLLNTNAFTERGAGEDVFVFILVTATVTSGGAATVFFALVTDSVTPVATFNILIQTGLIPKANLTINSSVAFVAPRGSAMTNLYKRYIAIDANIGTAVLTAGTFTAALVKSVQDATIYQPGFTLK